MANTEDGTSSDVALASGGEYQVFLSFRGPDTRYGFTDFLYDHLVDAGVRVFRDDDELRVGELIGENLLSAINNSIIYIPIFSRTYASSKWCLWELAHIVDSVSKSEDEKSIFPIFYDVEPDDVKLKTPIYSNALLEHERKFPDKVEAWRAALAEVGKIKGWKVKSSQAAIVKSIVKEVLEKLKIKQKSVTEHLVGLDDRIKDLTKLLDVNHDDVRLIGIYGMGGIGKTTIAMVIFNQLCSHFGKCCSFLENVRERSTKEGIVPLQKKLLSDIGGSGSIGEINDSEQGMERIKATLGNKKVLVVLDDVDEKVPIKNLIGDSKLYQGSRIIITTRDTSVLKVEGFNGETRQYEMLKMDSAPALQLFGRHAYSVDFPSDDYRRLSSDIVSSTGGLPLAIEVIGSLLNGKDQEIWEETLEKLRKVPEKKILEKLRISYDDLEKHHKQIFLDIACFFINENKTDAIYMWTDCQFYPKGGIKVLTDRCLVKILDNDKFWMHDQLRALGRQIVREDSLDDLGKQSRLCIVEEALQIISTKERKDRVQALSIMIPEITNEDFERFPNLRLLELRHGTYVGDFAKCHSNLRWFSWSSSPEKDFRADNLYLKQLVVCKLHNINFKDDSKAWDLIERAWNLKVLSFNLCLGIKTIPNISKCLHLERLTVEKCPKLERIESFIGNLHALIELKIEECLNLTNLPEEIGALVKLKHFSLSRCSRLRELPSSIGNLTSLTELDLSDTIIRKLPDSIRKLKSLRILRFRVNSLDDRENYDLQLPSSIRTLVNLEELDLSRHYDMKGEIHVGIGELSSLRILNLESTGICGIPRTINMLHHLQTLNLSYCHEIQELPELPTSLTCLLLISESLLSVPNLSNLTNLVVLQLSDYSLGTKKPNLITVCNLRLIGRLSRLKKLKLDLLNVSAPPELASLSHLKELDLRHLDLKPLMQLPSPDSSWRNLSTLENSCCEAKDISLEGLSQLERFTVQSCVRFQRLSIPSELRKLHIVDVSWCPELVEIQFVGLSKSLEYFSVVGCESLRKIGGLSYLKNLETLTIEYCHVLTNVEGLDELESLKSLDVRECESLRRLIDASCTNIPDDCVLMTTGCGYPIKYCRRRMSLKRYRKGVVLNTLDKDGAEFDISGSNEVRDSVSMGKSTTDGTSSIDDFQSEPGNTECFEAATGNRRQMRDGRIGRYDSVNGRKMASMENRNKDKDEIGELANPSNVVGSCGQTCKGVEHYEGSCKATTEVEDQRDFSYVKRDKTVETNQVLAKTGRGSATGCASNPGRDPTERGRGKDIAKSSRNGKGLRLGRDSTSTLGKGTASNSGSDIASGSRSSATSSSRGARGSTSGKGTTLSSGRGMTLSLGTGGGSSSRMDTTKMGIASSLGRGRTSSSRSSGTLSTERGRDSTSGKGTTVSSGRGMTLSLGMGRGPSTRMDTTKMGTASSPGRGITSSSRSSATEYIGRGRGSTSGKGTTVSSGRGETLSLGTGRGSSSRMDTNKMRTASSPGRGIISSSRSSVTLSTGRGRGSASGRHTTLSLGRGTTKLGTNLRSGTYQGSSSAKAEPQTSRLREKQ